MKNISLTQMSIEEFRAILREELESLMPTAAESTMPTHNVKEIMGVNEVVDFLGLKRSAIYHKTHLGTIPHFKKARSFISENRN